MDRIGKIALGVTAGAVVTASIVLVGSSTADSPAPRPRATATVTETVSPAFQTPKLKPETWTDGDYIIGDDIPFGTYTSAGAKEDVFALCMVTSSGKGHWPILKSANKDDRIILKLTADNKGDVLTISGCKPLSVRG